MSTTRSTQINTALAAYRRIASVTIARPASVEFVLEAATGPSMAPPASWCADLHAAGLTAVNTCADASKRPFGRGGPPVG